MLKLSFLGFSKHIVTNFFTALQLAAIFLIVISIVSSIESRYKFYLPFEDHLNCDGRLVSTKASFSFDIDHIEDVKKKYPQIKDAIGAYYVGNSSDGELKWVSYSDDVINRYIPDLKDGKWLTDINLSDDEIYGVVSSQSQLKVGDVCTITETKYAPDDKEFKNEINTDYDVKVIGVLKDDALVFGVNEETSIFGDFRDIYKTSGEEYNYLLLSQSQLSDKGIGYSIYNQLLISFQDNITEEDIIEIDKSPDFVASIDMSDINSHSLLYIYSQLFKLLPVLICVILLTVVSTVSITAINVNKGMRTHSVFYICGSSRKKCLDLHLLSSIYTILLAIIISIIVYNITILTGFLDMTVISISTYGVWACTGIAALELICSMISPLVYLKRKLLIKSLQSNE